MKTDHNANLGARSTAASNEFSYTRFIALTMLALMTLWSIMGSPARAQSIDLAPSTEYQPQEVVKIVIGALQNNNERNNDDGIATVYRFASPRNRAGTGPLARFTQMIKRGFPDMLNHTDASFDTMEVNGSTAVQAVWLLTNTGAEVGYAFKLGKQNSGEFDGMWMTEAVVPLGESAQSGTRI